MSFVPGQKVICINTMDHNPHLKFMEIYKIRDIAENIGELALCGAGVYTFRPERFQTIIESIDDVVPGMTLTVVDAVDRNNVGWLKNYCDNWGSYKHFDAFLGRSFTVKCTQMAQFHFRRPTIEFTQTGWYWPIELIKEYPGNVGVKKCDFSMLDAITEKCWGEFSNPEFIKKEIERAFGVIEALTKKETKMEKKYKIATEGGTIDFADIYGKRPKNCSKFDSEFTELLREACDPFDVDDVMEAEPILRRNIDWLEKVGLIEEVKPDFFPFNLTITDTDMLTRLTDFFGNKVGCFSTWKFLHDHCKRLGLRN